MPGMTFALLPIVWINILKCPLGVRAATLSCKRGGMFWPNWLLACWAVFRVECLCHRRPVICVTGRTGWNVVVGCVPLPAFCVLCVSDSLWYVHWAGMPHLRCGPEVAGSSVLNGEYFSIVKPARTSCAGFRLCYISSFVWVSVHVCWGWGG